MYVICYPCDVYIPKSPDVRYLIFLKLLFRLILLPNSMVNIVVYLFISERLIKFRSIYVER